MRFLANRSRRWRALLGVAVVVIVAGVVALIVAAGTRAGQPSQQQPLPFNHELMVQAGTPCLFCHTTAMRSPAAGMPSVEKCMGCHRTINPQAPAIQQLTHYWERQEPIPWVRVSQMPRFVYFSHRVHVASGVSCERCHGDVGHMAVVKPVARMNMGWCLSCHQQQPNAAQLRDCVVCHQ